jgi:hypothetical protein
MRAPLARPGRMLLLALAVATAAAAQAPPLSPAMRDAVRTHVLTEENIEPVITALRELSASMVADPDVAKQLLARMKLPAEQQVDDIAADPLSVRVLKAAGLGPRDYVVGVLAIRAAAGVPPGSSLAAAASPANAAFLRDHPDLLERFRAAERGQ